jgi:serine/threonine protein kinase
VIGQTISHYKITDKLGEGGMGVVYKAEDTRLDRPVALKFLAPHLLRDDEGRKRFEREAKAAAKLDHPNICMVFEIDEADGRTFIVMAFLEGQPLSERIKEGPLKLTEALSIAIQMAEGLEAAHEKGITHRDIKPDNVMLMAGSRGLVKLMDFGLAQLAGSSKFTREGTTLGTVNYMSPEQAEGTPTGHATDIWSLGVVLYEMVTGQKPFRGDFDQAIVYSIMNEPPETLTAVRSGVPKELERIVNKCLAKKPEQRYRHSDELLGDLQAVRQELEPQPSQVTAPPSPAKRLSPPLLGAGAVVLLSVLGLGWWFGRSSEPSVQVLPQYRLRQLTHDTGYTAAPAISPNGQLLAYASDRAGAGNLDIWVQQVSGGGDPVQLTSHPADESQPSFSPDGSQVVFHSQRDGGGIYLVAALGGSERLLARNGQRPRFSPDGQRVAYDVGDFLRESNVYVVPVAGGAPTELATKVAWASAPVWSPDGNHILFLGNDDEAFAAIETLDWWVVPADGGEPRRTGARESLSQAAVELVLARRGTNIAWVENPDRIVFGAGSGDTTNLYQTPLSPGTWHVEGTLQRLTHGVSEVEPSVAADGRIAYASIDFNADVWSIPMDANNGKLTGEREAAEDTAADEFYPTVSTDGKRLAFIMRRSGNSDVWVRDNETGRSSALVVTPKINEPRALLSPDGSTVTFMRGRYGNAELFLVPFEGGAEEKLADGVVTIISWSADSKRVLYATRGVETWNTIDIETHEVTVLLDNPGNLIHSPKLSPDGDWLLMKTFESPKQAAGAFIAPLRNGAVAPRSEWIMAAERKLVGTIGLWSPDGNLVYLPTLHEGFSCLYAQRLHPGTKQPMGEAFPVLHMHDDRLAPDYRLTTFGADRYHLGMRETTGNIWLAEPQAGP